MKFDFYNFLDKKDELSPFISSETIFYHSGKHHLTYYNNLKALLESSSLKDDSLENIILNSYNRDEFKSIYNNAAQVFNHDFYFLGLKKNIGPSSFVVDLINKNFNSLNAFKEEFRIKALSQFGSGWTWLVLDGENKLKIINTSNADNPLVLGLKPVLTIDLWEHAYYIDYKNSRGDYVLECLNNLVNWLFVEDNLRKHIVN